MSGDVPRAYNPTEITPFYRAFISFLSKKDLVKEIERRKKLQDTEQLFDPNGPLAEYIRKACFVACCYNLMTVPFRAAFELPVTWWWYVLDVLMDIPPIMRIVQCFMSPYEEEGRRDVVRNRITIVEKYLKGEFPWDFVSQLPIYYGTGDVRWRVLRFVQWRKLEYYQRDWERKSKIHPMTRRMLRVVFLWLMPIIHIVACLWFLVSSSDSSPTPVTPLPFDYIAAYAGTNVTFEDVRVNASEELEALYTGLRLNTTAGMETYSVAFQNYFSSLYFAMVYLVGYNAGIPRNTVQGLFSLAVVFLGSSVFAIIIGYVGMILRELDNTQQAFRDQVDSVVTCMKYSKMPKATVKNVLYFYKHMWESRRGLENLHVMQGLPQSLHRELLVYLHKDFVSKVPLFQGCDELFLEDVSCCLEYAAVLPTYYLLRKGEVGKEMFFIHKGCVDVVSEDGNVVFVSLSEGAFFGEVALVVPGAKRTASIRSKTFTELFVLNKTDFDTLLGSYPETRAKILEVAAERGLIEKPKPDGEGGAAKVRVKPKRSPNRSDLSPPKSDMSPFSSPGIEKAALEECQPVSPCPEDSLVEGAQEDAGDGPPMRDLERVLTPVEQVSAPPSPEGNGSDDDMDALPPLT
eukprot:TRINITY_DN1449_c0_g1_i2.p1 TRINITY_DN1449_c0_g1~~TRINITY_DN1449_c0_g1_i2.p1  ORF type:complete len:630 (+),score=265.64 TRINITY_DN1449_c0_g1_i2:184-2073(+)